MRSDSVQCERLRNLGGRQCIAHVLLVGEHEHARRAQVLALEDVVQLLARQVEPRRVRRVYHHDERVRVHEVRLPRLPQHVLPAQIPHLEPHVLPCHLLHVAANRGVGRYHLAQVQLVQYGCFARRVESYHAYLRAPPLVVRQPRVRHAPTNLEFPESRYPPPYR